MDQDNNIRREDVEKQLEKILRSEDFKRSPRNSDFLKFVVENSLNDDEERLKGYTIGIEVFGKPEDFNPDSDASVRVEATRLRKNLELYYHSQGKDDPIFIKIPKGKYKAIFFSNNNDNASQKSREWRAYFFRNKFITIAIITILALLSFFAYGSIEKERSPADIVETPANGPMTPMIAVLPFYTMGGVSSKEIGADLSYQLISKLARFDNLEALNAKGASNYQDWNGRSLEIAKELDVHYIIEGSIKKNLDTLHVSVRLLDVRSNNYVWNYSKAHEIDEGGIRPLIDNITNRIASAIGSPYGAIQNSEIARIASYNNGPSRAYSCVIKAYAYFNNKEKQSHKKARACLEEALKNYPSYVEAWSLLSYIYGDEVRYNFNVRDDEAQAEERSLRAAQMAININPNSARAHQYVAEAAKLIKDEALVKHHAKMAIMLNPYDSEILANTAWTYGVLGQWEDAKITAEKAIELNPNYPRWYAGILFAYYFQAGDYENALLHASRYYNEGDLWSHLAMAASYEGLFRHEEAQKHAKAIMDNFPEFVENPREELSYLGFGEPFIDKIIVATRAAGVNFQND